MEKISKIIFTLILAVLGSVTNAQSKVEMADEMRANGKIFVIVGIIFIVLIGFIVYLIVLDRKIKKLENLVSKKHSKDK